VTVTFIQSAVNWRDGLLPYTHWPLLGLAFGFGAKGGDCLQSVLKRLRGITPGKSWIPMDQIITPKIGTCRAVDASQCVLAPIRQSYGYISGFPDNILCSSAGVID